MMPARVSNHGAVMIASLGQGVVRTDGEPLKPTSALALGSYNEISNTVG